ncbi:hypothetical protein [uncultured Thomasclavelia sp.]|uniref:hypothetical protein n=1 Tax=uncultured Thomasclavelia sp. TaxID=3025759 RepID=UPI0025D2A33A|nr:hypothetical protein [uncultured Thomasclavelia sp.]
MHNKKSLYFYIAVPVLIALILAILFYDRYQRTQFLSKYSSEDTPVATNNDTNLPTIYCVGDSITLGANDTKSYPEYLQDLVSNEITVLGDNRINSAALAIKLGNQDVYVNNLTIPSSDEEVAITLYNENGEVQDAILNSQTGIDSCIINNITGSIRYDANTNQLLFKRLEAGSSTMITTLTKVEITKPEIAQDNILILFTGSYEESIQGSLVNYQNQILSAFNTDQYIVVSLTANDRNSTNNLLATTYGQHYLDFKNYLLSDGLNDAKLTPTADDQASIASGNVPASLLIDGLNGNNYYNQLLANQLFNKLTELGYLTNN